MLHYSQSSELISIDADISGSVQWTSPSNIALVKYWGKYGRQLPKNPSISFTLNNAKTTTLINYKTKPEPSDGISLSLFFEGERNVKFESKLKKFFSSITDVLPFLTLLDFEIISSNSFPHSAGIASSASAMSAIACCLCDIELQLLEKDEKIDLLRASYISRLGSGSASRSIFQNMAIWGEFETHNDIPYSNLYANKYEDFHPIFGSYHDDILIVSKKEKSVSSTAGHQLMEQNVYAEARYKQASDRLELLLAALKDGDQETFGRIVEDEALTLHALMMSSDPSFLLIHPNTLHIINRIRDYRSKTGTMVFFTLDAGPNIHLLYSDEIKEEIAKFTQDELAQYCEDGLIIKDIVGQGPVKLN